MKNQSLQEQQEKTQDQLKQLKKEVEDLKENPYLSTPNLLICVSLANIAMSMTNTFFIFQLKHVTASLIENLPSAL